MYQNQKFGLGSTNIIIFTKRNKIKNQKKTVIQKYYEGKKGGLPCYVTKKIFKLFAVIDNY